MALGDVATLSAQEPDPARDFPRLRCVARRLTQVTPLGAYHFHCRAPPGRLGLAFKDATRVVVRVNATSALCGTVREGDELVSVNDCVVADDDFLGVLTAQDDGATARALVFSRCDDCKIWAATGIGFEPRTLRSSARRPEVCSWRWRRAARDRATGAIRNRRGRSRTSGSVEYFSQYQTQLVDEMAPCTPVPQ